MTNLLMNCTFWLAVLPRLIDPEAGRDMARQLLLPPALHLRLLGRRLMNVTTPLTLSTRNA